MKYEDLAAKAGRDAADVGRHVRRPRFEHITARHRRRTLITGTVSTATALAVMVAVVVALQPRPLEEQPPVAAITATKVPAVSSAPTPAATPPSRAECPVTIPGTSPFEPAARSPEGPPSSYAAVWFGTPELWTMIGREGEVWTNLPAASDGAITQKTFWWTDDAAVGGPDVEITVSAERLGGPPLAFTADQGTNGGHPELGVFTVVGLDIPKAGCWRITAEYQGASLSYVAWVDPGQT